MGEALTFICDQCGKSKVSHWQGEPQGWVRLGACAKWDGTNYHIYSGEWKKSFCSIGCFVKFMQIRR